MPLMLNMSIMMVDLFAKSALANILPVLIVEKSLIKTIIKMETRAQVFARSALQITN